MTFKQLFTLAAIAVAACAAHADSFTLLNLMLGHDEPRLALRFPPRDPRLPREWFRTAVNVESRTAFTGIGRRLALLQTLF